MAQQSIEQAGGNLPLPHASTAGATLKNGGNLAEGNTERDLPGQWSVRFCVNPSAGIAVLIIELESKLSIPCLAIDSLGL